MVDILYPCDPDIELLYFMSSGMSGDFCRCMGWAYLFPKVIDEGEGTFPKEEYIEQEESEAVCRAAVQSIRKAEPQMVTI